MIKLPYYSFKVDFKDISRADIRLQIEFNDKSYLSNNSLDIEIAIYRYLRIWENLSFYGGYVEKIDKMHSQIVFDKRKKIIELAVYLKEDQLMALKNLFYLFDVGFNKNNKTIKIINIIVSSIDCNYNEYINFKNGRL